jgi:hypothetical protein
MPLQGKERLWISIVVRLRKMASKFEHCFSLSNM